MWAPLREHCTPWVERDCFFPKIGRHFLVQAHPKRLRGLWIIWPCAKWSTWRGRWMYVHRRDWPSMGLGWGMGAHRFQAALYRPAVLVLGNEDKGMRPNVGKRCETVLTIPMRGGFDSVNVAQAGAMIMTEMLRQWQTPTPSSNQR